MNGRPSLFNLTSAAPLCRTVLVADSYWLRLRGLLCRPELDRSSGLLLLPSRGIHTIGMRCAIDAVFLNSDLKVLRVCAAVPPWQVRLAAPGTHCVLELRQGQAAHAGLAAGHQLQLLHEHGAAEAPCGLQEGRRRPLQHLFGVLLTALLCAQVALCCWSFRASLLGRVDLRAYYAAGMAARLFGNATLYNTAVEQATQQALFHDGWRTLHFLYPPFAMLPYRALAALPYRPAFAAVTLCSLLCLMAVAWLLARSFPRAGVSPAVLLLCGLCSFSSVIALTQGQLSFAMLLLLTLFYSLERRGLHVLAGLCLALCLVKVQLALPVAVLYLLWRRYRVVAGFAAGALVLFAVSYSVSGVAGLRAYVAQLRGIGSATLLDGAAAHLRYGVQTNAEPNLHGLAVALLGSSTASGALTLALSLVVLLWAARRPASIGTATCAAVLLSYHLISYDLVLLLLPLALYCLQRLQQEGSAERAAPQAKLEGYLLGGSLLLLSGPFAAALALLQATAAYALAAVALLVLGSRGEPPQAAAAADPTVLPRAADETSTTLRFA